VHRHDVAAAGMVEAGGKGRGLPEVAPEPNHAQPWIAILQPRERLEALVGAPVVDDQDFVRPSPRGEALGELAVELFERRRLVADRDDDAELHDGHDNGLAAITVRLKPDTTGIRGHRVSIQHPSTRLSWLPGSMSAGRTPAALRTRSTTPARAGSIGTSNIRSSRGFRLTSWRHPSVSSTTVLGTAKLRTNSCTGWPRSRAMANSASAPQAIHDSPASRYAWS